MTIAFCGHSSILNQEIVRTKVFSLLKSLPNEFVTFLIGGYGDFDYISMRCCKDYKSYLNPQAHLCFVTPYLNEDFLKKKSFFTDNCDEVIYPDLERTPPKYAILQRNRRMIDQADLLICYINYSWSGAYKAYNYAKKKKHCAIINIGRKE